MIKYNTYFYIFIQIQSFMLLLQLAFFSPQETNVNINLTERALSSTINPVANPSPDAEETPSLTSEEIKPNDSKTSEPNVYTEQNNQLQSCVNFLKQVVHPIKPSHCFRRRHRDAARSYQSYPVINR